MTPLSQLSASVPRGLVHGLPASDYHSGPGVSASHLKAYALDPAQFKYDIEHATARTPTEAQLIGTLAHGMILENNTEPPPDIAVKPEGMSFATANGKAWRAANEGKRIVSFDAWEHCIGMAEAIANDKDAAMFVKLGKPEVAVYASDEETGLTMRCRFDMMPDCCDVRFDLKTAESASKADFAKAIGAFNYHWSAAWYLAVEEAATSVRPKAWAWLVVSKTPPHQIGIYFASPADIEAGHRATRFYFKHLAEALKTGKFLSTAEKFTTIQRPHWQTREDVA